VGIILRHQIHYVMIRRDLLTNEEFTPTRNNQKFARSSNRIKYHNQRANAVRYSSAFINKPLMNNLRILNELLSDKGEKVFHKEYLKGKGFNFGVCTHCMVMENQNRFCYYQYVLINGVNDTVKIIKYNG
jgi:hypothetical protein